jgi:hypothetical protein
MRRTAFTMLIHAHDYLWNRGDRKAAQLVWELIILQSLDGCVEIEL